MSHLFLKLWNGTDHGQNQVCIITYKNGSIESIEPGCLDAWPLCLLAISVVYPAFCKIFHLGLEDCVYFNDISNYSQEGLLCYIVINIDEPKAISGEPD